MNSKFFEEVKDHILRAKNGTYIGEVSEKTGISRITVAKIVELLLAENFITQKVVGSSRLLFPKMARGVENA